MRRVERSTAAASLMVVFALLAGCGGGGGLYGNPGSPTATSGAAGSGAVQTASVSVNGQQETVLTDSRSYTLYYFDNDSSSTSACTGACAQTWPPLTTNASSVPAPAGATGTMSVVQDGNGNQVEYNGHPLYTYSGDTGPRQSNGNGIEGKWHVATPSIPVNNGSGGGYGYGGRP
jgi:predicted lipoprotein with Yx(FWY)xxD motif